MRKIATALALLGCLLAAQLSAETPGPIKLSNDIEIDGKPLRVDVELQLAATPAADGHPIVRATLDLAPVVSALRAGLLRRLPRDVCRHHRADNWVASIDHYSARVDRAHLVFDVGLDVEVWACLAFRGRELRKRLSRDQVRVQLALRVDVEDAGLRLHVERPWVRAHGRLADAARAYFALRGEEMGDLLARKVARLNAHQQAFAVPALWLHQGKLVSARFVDAGRPSLELVAELEPSLPGWMDWMLGRRH